MEWLSAIALIVSVAVFILAVFSLYKSHQTRKTVNLINDQRKYIVDLANEHKLTPEVLTDIIVNNRLGGF